MRKEYEPYRPHNFRLNLQRDVGGGHWRAITHVILPSEEGMLTRPFQSTCLTIFQQADGSFRLELQVAGFPRAPTRAVNIVHHFGRDGSLHAISGTKSEVETETTGKIVRRTAVGYLQRHVVPYLRGGVSLPESHPKFGVEYALREAMVAALKKSLGVRP